MNCVEKKNTSSMNYTCSVNCPWRLVNILVLRVYWKAFHCLNFNIWFLHDADVARCLTVKFKCFLSYVLLQRLHVWSHTYTSLIRLCSAWKKLCSVCCDNLEKKKKKRFFLLLSDPPKIAIVSTGLLYYLCTIVSNSAFSGLTIHES